MLRGKLLFGIFFIYVFRGAHWDFEGNKLYILRSQNESIQEDDEIDGGSPWRKRENIQKKSSCASNLHSPRATPAESTPAIKPFKHNLHLHTLDGWKKYIIRVNIDLFFIYKRKKRNTS